MKKRLLILFMILVGTGITYSHCNDYYDGAEDYYHKYNANIDTAGLSIAALMETNLFESLLDKDSIYSSKVITVKGIARNANPGAFIETDDYSTYYLPLEQMTEWDADLYLGKKVEITGEWVVEEQDMFIGDQVVHRVFNVIHHATYRLIKESNE